MSPAAVILTRYEKAELHYRTHVKRADELAARGDYHRAAMHLEGAATWARLLSDLSEKLQTIGNCTR